MIDAYRPLLGGLALTFVQIFFSAACSSSSGMGELDGGEDAPTTHDANGGHEASASADGASTSGSASISGTESCQSLTGAHAVAIKGVYDPSYPGLVSIFIVNHEISCPDGLEVFGGGAAYPDEVIVGFTVGATDASTVVVPGTYTGGSLTGGCAAFDAQCTQLPGGGENTGGTVTLTSAGPTYTGTFTIDCPCGSYSGSFEAPQCSAPDADAGGSGDGGTVCLK